MSDLEKLLEKSSSRHSHLCPRQVLGVRMGIAGASKLGMEIPRQDKGLLVIVETDGCFADGVEVATGCTVGHRTLRVEDYGKVGATFIEVETGRAVRLAPSLDVRSRSKRYAPDRKRRYFAMLEGYQRMPLEELFTVESVALATPVDEIVSRAGVRVNCEACGEEIINERETCHDGQLLCKACEGESYYRTIEATIAVPSWAPMMSSKIEV